MNFLFLVLQKLRNLSVSDLVIDISVMRKEQNSLQNCSSSSFTSLFTNKDFRLPIFLVCALHIGQQLIGINAVSVYDEKRDRIKNKIELYLIDFLLFDNDI